MSKKKAVLFDLDGTLIDTKDLILSSFRKASQAILGKEIPDEEVLPLIGIPLLEQAYILAPEHAEELIDSYRQFNIELHEELIRSFDGITELLEALLAKERRLAVVTSKRNIPAMEGLESFNLQGYFEFVSGMEESHKHKPNPEPLLVAAKRMGEDIADCIYVGDSIYDMLAARAAGAVAVAVLWGVSSREELLKAGAQFEAATPAELLCILEDM
ncbi:MAG: HAD-IA family hydrolase [Eggerthellaceae bacterium]|nr:HAD-IA family hydrolase [Eggerthellaceae bacterium]